MSRTPVTSQDQAEKVRLVTQSTNAAFVLDRKTNIELRRIDVVKLRLRGMTVDEIAFELQVSTPTVRSDIVAIRESNEKYINSFDQDDFIAESLNVFNRVEQVSWDQVSKLGDKDPRKTKFLAEIRSARKHQITLLQSCGLLREKARKIEVEVKNTTVDGWSSQQRDIVSEALLEASILEGEMTYASQEE